MNDAVRTDAETDVGGPDTGAESLRSERLPHRVLHVLNSPTGGAALSTISLARALGTQGIESSAVCMDTGTQSERQRLADAVGGRILFTPLYWSPRKTRVKTWKRPILEALQLWQTGWRRTSTRRVMEFACRHGVELIHTNTIYTPEGALAARRLGLPHVWHVRELIGTGQTVRLPWEGAALGRYLLRLASKVVANSHATARLLQDWLPPELLDVVPNGIELADFSPRTSPRQGPVVVAMVANLTSRWKKHNLLVEVAARIPQNLHVEFRFYGHDPSQGGTRRSDPYVDALHARIRQLGIADRFTWPGFVADPAKIMSDVDVLFHPADGESFGRVLVEAMAAGVPVVSVRAYGPEEIVVSGTTGFLVEPDNVAEMTVAVERLAGDAQLRAQLGAAGRRRAEECYSLTACVLGIRRAYAAAMQHPLRTRP